MPSMNYCAIENTVDEMEGVLRKLEQGNVEDWNEYELRKLESLFDLAESIAELREEIMDMVKEMDNESTNV